MSVHCIEVEELVKCPRDNDYVEADACEDCEFNVKLLVDRDGHQYAICKYVEKKREAEG